MFYEAQEYEIKKIFLFQDIESEIKTEKNRRESCTGNSIHLNIQHFFIKDRVYKEEIEVKLCPTHLMIADCFTNPLQGKLFKLFCGIIMGYKQIGDMLAHIESAIKERVGNQNKVIENPNLKNNNKRTIQFQVININSDLNSSPTGKKRAKKESISINKSEKFFVAFRDIIRCCF